MKRAQMIILILLLALSLAACGTTVLKDIPSQVEIDAFYKVMDTWLSNTNYGIIKYSYDVASNQLCLTFKAGMYEKLSSQDKNDISITALELLGKISGSREASVTFAMGTSGTASSLPTITP